jgi:hypothetical protein
MPSPCRPPISFIVRIAASERDRRRLRRDLDLPPMRDAHDRIDDPHARREQLQVLGLVRRPEQVGVGRVRLLRRGPVRKAALGKPLAHLRATTELADESGVEPRLVDAQVLVREQAVAVEPLDVVALVRRAVTPDLDVVAGHRPHEQRPGDGATERGRIEVPLAGRLDVERAAAQRRETLPGERVLAVHEHSLLGAARQCALRHRRDVGLVVLAEVRGERIRDRPVLPHPRNRAAGVEAA